jgi:hypothetical protein
MSRSAAVSRRRKRFRGRLTAQLGYDWSIIPWGWILVNRRKYKIRFFTLIPPRWNINWNNRPSPVCFYVVQLISLGPTYALLSIAHQLRHYNGIICMRRVTTRSSRSEFFSFPYTRRTGIQSLPITRSGSGQKTDHNVPFCFEEGLIVAEVRYTQQ